MNLKAKIGKLTFNNPIWVASGTFGSSDEFCDFVDLNKIGAFITKTITLKERIGNPPPRVVETPSGLLNSIGLENKGVDHFIREKGPFLKKLKTKVIVSIAANSLSEFEKCIKKISTAGIADAVELNLSCPNVEHKASKQQLIAQDPASIKQVLKVARKSTKLPIITKLTPNVTNIRITAKAAETAGADAVSLVNTFFGMAVDVKTQSPVLGNVTGGVSGPAIKPMALKAVWDVYNAVKIPIVGMGGITTGACCAEFMLCGATCVQIGTANLVEPSIYNKIFKEFQEYLKINDIKEAKYLIGKLKVKK